MKIFSREEIETNLPTLDDLFVLIEEGFVSYSNGECIIPDVGYLPIPTGEIHIKYGLQKESEFAVIKVASGCYSNSNLGLPSSSGLNLIINTRTGVPEALLQDEGLLTDIRTAIAGALAATRYAKNTKKFGVIGYKTSDTVRGMQKNFTEKIQGAYILLSDQSPQPHKTFYWREFFNIKVW